MALGSRGLGMPKGDGNVKGSAAGSFFSLLRLDRSITGRYPIKVSDTWTPP